jgi:hypothetical protein
MPIETATYISGLDATQPPGADPVSQADDHLRLIKSCLKATFPNVTGPVTATHTQLNAGTPIGGIIMWSGSIVSIPSGWGLCDGSTYTRSDGGGSIVAPNLKDVFVIGAGNLYAVGATGGVAAKSFAFSFTVDPTTLTLSQIPAHAHSISDTGHVHGVSDPSHTHPSGAAASTYNVTAGGGATVPQPGSATGGAVTGIAVLAATTGIIVNQAGGGGSHTHTALGSTTSSSILPPYYALALIMKT